MAGMEEMEVIEGKDERRRVAGDLVDVGVVDAPAKVKGPRDFESKSVAARALVISAGVIMNVIFAFLVFGGAALVWGVTPPEPSRLATPAAADLPPGAQALTQVPMGARIVSIGAAPVSDWDDVDRLLETAQPGSITIRFADAPPASVTIPADEKARKSLLRVLQPAQEPVVGGIMQGSAAASAGMKPGDRILTVAGTPVRFWQDMVHTVQAHAGQATPLVVQRGESTLALTATPRATPDTLADGKTVRTVGRLGIIPVMPPPVRLGLGGAIAYGARETWSVVELVVGFLRDLVTGHQSPRNLGGPILIGQLSGQVARAGLESFLKFMALFSVNLAVLNLLPIPVLDGGHLMFILVEAVRGRALTLQQRARLMQVGFVLVVALMVWAVANDVLRLFGV